MTSLIKSLAVSGGIGTCLLLLLCKQSLLFVSKESKTVDNHDVYNEIQFFPGWEKDTWVMRQSHEGLQIPHDTWDRLAIVVDKTQRPFKALFYQLEPGPMEFNENSKPAPFRAPCLSCHANGPRAIRPQAANLWQTIQTSLLNLRIKSYWQVRSINGQPHNELAPFKRQHKALDKPIKAESCRLCHGDGKLRNGLTMQQLTTAKFLVQNKQMPPWPLTLSDADPAFF